MYICVSHIFWRIFNIEHCQLDWTKVYYKQFYLICNFLGVNIAVDEICVHGKWLIKYDLINLIYTMKRLHKDNVSV